MPRINGPKPLNLKLYFALKNLAEEKERRFSPDEILKVIPRCPTHSSIMGSE